MSTFLRGKHVFLLAILAATISFGKLEAEDKPAPAQHLLKVSIKGAVPEQGGSMSLFAPAAGASLRELCDSIRTAGGDDKVSALVLDIGNAAVGTAQSQAIRRELIAFRKSGKKSFCHMATASTGSYLLASACSEVSLHPAGGLELVGPGAQFMHFHGLLKKVGVTFQELRMGRYKSALESYTRDGPSEPVLEEMHAILDDLYEDQVAALAENRGMKPIVVRGHIDTRMFSPADAKKAGLVDHVEYEDEFLDRIRGEGDKALKVVDSTKKKEVKLEGLTGLMTLFNELFGSPKKKAGTKKDKIALIYALGAISTGAEGQSLFSFGGMTSETMVKAIRKAREDKTVKAVVLRVDSPGGSALASDFIWREIVLTRKVKPVVVSMGNVAASGGYYIACPANWIVAESGTITGSIGVIGAITSMKGLYDKAGLKVTTITRGKRGDLIDGYGRISPEGRKLIMKEMQRIYDDFLSHVAKGRKLPKKAVASIAEGRVWTGKQAHKLGLVDELGGLDTALAKARELSKTPEAAELMILPESSGGLFDFLPGIRAGALLEHALQDLPLEARQALRSVSWISSALGRERVLAVMPWSFRIRWAD
ncbi:MAG: signal peptide peptidase SppA [Planctomycetota bacterium]